MKVLCLTFIPSPYRLSFFEELGKHCELTVLFERSQSKYREGNWKNYCFCNFNGKILKGITTRQQDKLCFGCVKYLLDRSYDIIILSNPFSPTGFLAASILKTFKIPYVVECDGAFPTGYKSWKTKLKGYVVKSAKMCMSTAKLTDSYYLECGVSEVNLFRYPFSSVKDADIIERPLNSAEKSTIKKKLQIENKPSVITIGRFVPGKGFDMLIDVASHYPNINFYFIGGKATKEYIEQVDNLKLSNCYFLDFMPKEKIFTWLKACDLFVLPTRSDVWGLVINEAMACGLPVISTDMCIAALEMIKDGYNGYVYHVDDIEQLGEQIGQVFENQTNVASMGKNAIAVAHQYTIETMTAAHIHAFNKFKRLLQ